MYNAHNLFTEEERRLWTNLELYTLTFQKLMFEVSDISNKIKDDETKRRLYAVAQELGVLVNRSEGDFTDRFEVTIKN